jgi:hypothetical protein
MNYEVWTDEGQGGRVVAAAFLREMSMRNVLLLFCRFIISLQVYSILFFRAGHGEHFSLYKRSGTRKAVLLRPSGWRKFLIVTNS